MKKLTLVTILMTTVLALGVLRPWDVVSAHGGSPPAGVDSATSGAPKNKGNGFVKALKAPFKAIGKLFGGGKDDGKPRRLTEKDVKKFETAQTVRIDDARSPLAAIKSPDDTAAEVFRRGRAMLEDGHVNGALDLLSRAVALDPQLGEAYNLLGVAYDRKGFPQLARGSFERALNISRNDVQTLNNFGYSLYRNGDYRGAVEILKRAAKQSPNDRRVWNNLALAQCRLGKFEDAYKSFARAGGELKGHLNIASVLERSGREEAAIKHYEAARLLQPDSRGVLQHLASLYQRTGRTEKAEEVRSALIPRSSGTPAAAAAVATK